MTDSTEPLAPVAPPSARRKKAAASGTAATKAVATPVKRTAMSLHIGLNAVSPAHYAGWSGELDASGVYVLTMAAADDKAQQPARAVEVA